jgi:hypothetical protein
MAALEHEMVVTRYHLRTRALQLRGATPSPPALPFRSASGTDALPEGERGAGEGNAPHQIGFMGRCAFTCFSPERALWRTLHLLADFAFFCGTGYKTTQGMGQTRRVKAEGGRQKAEG